MLLLEEKRNKPLHQLNDTLRVYEENLSVSLPLQGGRMAV